MRKHRLAERLLIDVIGLEWEYVHDEACRWEHVMSDRVEAKLLNMLGGPLESPYGNPIPGLEELGGPAARRRRVPPRAAEPAGRAGRGGRRRQPPRFAVRRLGERLQMDVDLMRRLADAGIRPGARRQRHARRLHRDGRARGAGRHRGGRQRGRRGAPVATAVTAAAGAATGAAVAAGSPLDLPVDVARHVFVEPID